MPTVSNDMPGIVFILRPIGFKLPHGGKINPREILEWRKNEKPNIFFRQSYLTLGGVVSTVLGVVLGLLGIKSESKLNKALGGFLTLAGIGGWIMGLWGRIDVLGDRFEKEEKQLKDNLLDELKNLPQVNGGEDAEEQLRPVFKKYKSSEKLGFITGELTRISSLESENEEVRSKAKLLLSIFNEDKKIQNVINHLKDKSIDIEKRRSEVFFCTGDFSRLTRDFSIVPISIDTIKDKSEDEEIRKTCIDNLMYIDSFEEMQNPDFIKTLIDCIKDKSDNANVRIKAADCLAEGYIKLLKDKDTEFLIDHIKDKTEPVDLRKNCISILTQIEGENNIKKLSSILEDNSEDNTIQQHITNKIKNIDESLDLRTAIIKMKMGDLISAKKCRLKGSLDYGILAVLSRNMSEKLIMVKLNSLPRNIDQQIVISSLKEEKVN